MSHPLRCACGTLHGHVEPSPGARRAVCYCRDCRAYARHLGADGVLDAKGGTEVVAMHPRHVHFAAADTLACLSLRKGGLLRWYASCCNTPIANIPRDPKIAYAGVVHSCLDFGGQSLSSSFGTTSIAVNTKSALGEVHESKLATFGAVAHIGVSLLAARLSGSWRETPFMRDGVPVRTPTILSAEERERAYHGDQGTSSAS